MTMTRPSRPRVLMIYVKEYWLAIIASALMSGGIREIISTLSQPIANGIIRFINAISLRAFRDITPPLPGYVGIPWYFYVRVVAIAIMVIVAGIFVGLWANLRSQPQSTVEALPMIQK